ncbi:L-threonylcarbamoyladenylate synthase [uncultured Cardiobacterium sp.]|uniref:L-threonylcarbamoyladenylate synthase n=1 Tax=uncultured Cardiobacterium sp. TaxID=417619 RepID=UPI0026098DE9|nr:L-threonylcarbamoyladenylate synthase [uncultured Cardiobacterium sp.]
MSDILEIHPERIKPRDIDRVADIIRSGAVAVVPSDSGYALLCRLDDKAAAEKIRHIRALDRDHPFTILCADLGDLARYARVDNVQYRLLKTLFPGAYTCILPASREVPRRVQNDKRKTIGIRVPAHPVMQALLAAHGEALMGVSLFDGDDFGGDIHDLPAAATGLIDLIVDAGDLPLNPTTVLDLTVMPPAVLRQGAGDVANIT